MTLITYVVPLENAPGMLFHAFNKCAFFSQVKDIRGQLKAQQQLSEGAHEDPDSRMETDRERRTHIDKKSTKGKGGGGLRGSGKTGAGFWRN